jgi:predicted PurR-regulated permease PerM
MAKNLVKPGNADDLPRQEDSASANTVRAPVSHAVRIRSIAIPGIFLILTVAALKYASAFFVPVVLALLLNFLFASVIRGLARLRIAPPIGAALVLLALLGSLGFGIYQLAAPASEWIAQFPRTVRQIEGKLRNFKLSIQKVTRASQEVEKLTDLGGGEKTQKVEVQKSTLKEALLRPTQDFLVGTTFVFTVLFFLLASGDLFLRKVVNMLPTMHDKRVAVEISRQIEHDVSAYLVAITMLNIVLGAAVGTAMYFFGLPNPILWGVMAGILHFIPYLGAIVGITIVTTVALVTLENMTTVLLVPVTYLGLDLLAEYLVLPLVMGRRLTLNPVVILVWVIFWGWMWGIPGALMAVPLLAIVRIICDHIEPFAPIAEFLGQSSADQRPVAERV